MTHLSSTPGSTGLSLAEISIPWFVEVAATRAWIGEKSKGSMLRETSCMMGNVAQEAQETDGIEFDLCLRLARLIIMLEGEEREIYIFSTIFCMKTGNLVGKKIVLRIRVRVAV